VSLSFKKLYYNDFTTVAVTTVYNREKVKLEMHFANMANHIRFEDQIKQNNRMLYLRWATAA